MNITITLNETLREFAINQSQRKGFTSVEDYLCDLIALDQNQEQLESSLLQALNSPKKEWTKDDMDHIRTKVFHADLHRPADLD